jgi:cell division transport system ATP-binding protein
MIQMTGVSKYYFGQTRVLDHVQLNLNSGDFLYVVGGSGAGKTTLLRLLATEEAASAGTLSMFGYNLNSIAPTTLRAIRQSIGYIPQDVRLIPDLTVYDNVALSLSLAGRRVLGADARLRVSELLDRLGLGPRKEKLAGTLSGGEAQRVAIARALVRQPELIIADEPTGAQDRELTWSVMDLFLRANLGGATVVLATHDREIVRRVRKRCAVLKAGRLTVEEALCIY